MMTEEDNSKTRNGLVVNRRSILRTTGAALATSGSIAGISGSAAAENGCPEPDNGESYWDCWDDSETWDEANGMNHNPDGDRYQAQIKTSIGAKNTDSDDCDNCVYYHFDIASSVEARKKYEHMENKPNIWSYGIRWNASDSVTGDPQPLDSNNTQSGISDPDGDASAEDDKEEAFLALADVIVAGGTLLYPAYSGSAFLYTVARTSDMFVEEEENQVTFSDNTDKHKAVNFAMNNFRFQVDEYESGTVEIETFVNATHEHTLTSKTFDLDRHL
ncbi:hypothetical protein BN996_01364 [Haloferax massiliensis]|uniref:Uncharacterized protein n=2 Tax=Haloferacaceae TaxID=1644056 RepID=A0A0D6JQJ5_9EURY|nr:hypothetical protein BN996_01364 [Haloferax massiliensis]